MLPIDVARVRPSRVVRAVATDAYGRTVEGSAEFSIHPDD